MIARSRDIESHQGCSLGIEVSTEPSTSSNAGPSTVSVGAYLESSVYFRAPFKISEASKMPIKWEVSNSIPGKANDRLYPRNAAALDRGLEIALGFPTIPELGLPTPRKMRELTLGCPT